MRYLVPDESHVQPDQPYAEIEARAGHPTPRVKTLAHMQLHRRAASCHLAAQGGAQWHAQCS